MLYLQDTLSLIVSNTGLFLGLLFAVGLVVGSFLNVVIYRLPIMMMADWQGQAREILKLKPEPSKDRVSLSYPSSSCPSCQTEIKWYDNVPVLSYLMLKGRCRKCETPISARYPIVEFLVAMLTVAFGVVFGPSLYLLCALLLLWGVVAAASIDFSHQILPDIVTYPLLWLGMVIAYLGVGPVGLEDAFLGVIAGFLPLWLIKTIYGRIRGVEGLGDGDLKLFALFGAWVGYEVMLDLVLLSVGLQLIAMLWLAAIRCVLHKNVDMSHSFAFGPAITVAGILIMLT